MCSYTTLINPIRVIVIRAHHDYLTTGAFLVCIMCVYEHSCRCGDERRNCSIVMKWIFLSLVVMTAVVRKGKGV